MNPACPLIVLMTLLRCTVGLAIIGRASLGPRLRHKIRRTTGPIPYVTAARRYFRAADRRISTAFRVVPDMLATSSIVVPNISTSKKYVRDRGGMRTNALMSARSVSEAISNCSGVGAGDEMAAAA